MAFIVLYHCNFFAVLKTLPKMTLVWVWAFFFFFFRKKNPRAQIVQETPQACLRRPSPLHLIGKIAYSGWAEAFFFNNIPAQRTA